MEQQRRARRLKGGLTYDEFLSEALDAYEAVHGDKPLDELNVNSNSEDLAENSELSEEIDRLRRELDEFKTEMPRRVAEEQLR